MSCPISLLSLMSLTYRLYVLIMLSLISTSGNSVLLVSLYTCNPPPLK